MSTGAGIGRPFTAAACNFARNSSGDSEGDAVETDYEWTISNTETFSTHPIFFTIEGLAHPYFSTGTRDECYPPRPPFSLEDASKRASVPLMHT